MPFFYSLFFGYLVTSCYLDSSGYLRILLDTTGYLLQLVLGGELSFFCTFNMSLKTKSPWSSFSGTHLSKKTLIIQFN